MFPVKALSSVLETSHKEFARFPPTGWRRRSVLSGDRQSRGLVGRVSNMRIYCSSASKPECCRCPTRSCDQHTSCQPHSNLHNMLIINLDINLDFGSRSTGACTHMQTHMRAHTLLLIRLLCWVCLAWNHMARFLMTCRLNTNAIERSEFVTDRKGSQLTDHIAVKQGVAHNSSPPVNLKANQASWFQFIQHLFWAKQAVFSLYAKLS